MLFFLLNDFWGCLDIHGREGDLLLVITLLRTPGIELPEAPYIRRGSTINHQPTVAYEKKIFVDGGLQGLREQDVLRK